MAAATLGFEDQPHVRSHPAGPASVARQVLRSGGDPLADRRHDPNRWLVLGPDTAGNVLELVVLISVEGDEMIVHAMPMRPKYRRLFER